ncbi:ArsO family NAD(P)H-dependent flavin-containing monooxygenase [Brevibacterium sp. 50QC2O2]|uniref:ArsO family NAD(P)H-dependent flavin-containing monooxygenase n=1 Tax=Brevibacterium TaxID=1696 RepID=UPI00211B7FCB|nr:ArsO family NAD(P)H-dependent flavin-containing monooxygenase [Brevibacterium sp. 68QC2CO]MCQ9387677.1 ArsO family NAD(P)H-dependent flavin-containing monooxygenase [Brevibacterium sp. 50QC2O2]
MIDVVVIGGGQAGLAAGFYLRRSGLDFVILDAQTGPGGAWRHGWESLRLFSPAQYSPLPGWPMPPQPGETFPTAAHVAQYLADYEARYELPVHRPVRVHQVRWDAGAFVVGTDRGEWVARAVISATGTWQSPHVPAYPGQDAFTGPQLHTVDYRTPERFSGQRVVVVGGGNSAAQILAEVSTVADTLWVTARPPRFMPDDVDGRVLFDVATARAAAQRAGVRHDGVAGLGDIVMVPPVREARDRGVLHAVPMFDRLTSTGVAWSSGREYACDAVIWCTGFAPHLDHLAPLGLTLTGGHPATAGTRSVDHPGLHLLGYGDWTGFASATLIGAGRTAKLAVTELRTHLAPGSR